MVTLKTSSMNWIDDLSSVCESQEPIQIINNSSLDKEAFIHSVNRLLKDFTLSSKLLVLRKVLVILIPIMGISFTVILGYGVIVLLTSDIEVITSQLFAFVFCVLLSIVATKKLISAKKPDTIIKENEIIIRWNKY